jgi:hypothetical protein
VQEIDFICDMEGPPMDHLLTDEERQGLARDGYVLRRGVFQASEVAEMTAACEQLVSRLVAGRQGERQVFGSYVFDLDEDADTMIKWEGDSDVVHGIEPLAHLSPELEQWAGDERFVAPMIDLVDDPAPELFTEKLNLKRPLHGGHNPLHQDFPYWENFAADASRVATAMLFLDDATLENGTLQVVPGSHKDGKWTTRRDRDDFGNLEIDPSQEEGLETVPIEVEAGSVVYFGAFLVHKSAPNQSSKQRRSLLFSYQPRGLPHTRQLMRDLREKRAQDTDASAAAR